MHGRRALTLSLTTLLIATSSAAQASTAGVGPDPLAEPGPAAGPCAPRCTVIGLGAPAPADGVVVRWRVRTSAAATLRLRTVQPLGGGQYVATASGSDESVAPGAVRTFAARVPVARDGLLALAGTSVPARAAGSGSTATVQQPAGTFDDGAIATAATETGGTLQVAADVESDADGDGYGDDTQDACPGNGTDHALPCDTTRTVGSPLTAAPDASQCSAARCAFFQTGLAFGATPAPDLSSPIDGIVTRWTFRALTTNSSYVLQRLRPQPDGRRLVGPALAPAIPATGRAPTSVKAALSVRRGDQLGLATATATPFEALRASTGDELSELAPAPAENQTVMPSVRGAYRLLLQADVETDLDGNGKADISEDRADLQVTPSAPANAVAGQQVTHTYTVRNNGPSTALRVTWPGGAADRLAPGATLDVPVTVPAGEPGPASSSFSVSAMTPDPQDANNAASATTLVTPPSVAPPPLTFAVKPCANVIRGSRDDDALRGTVFGDRLIGLDGKDFLKGGSGDDCLEGGQGGDVLDGEAGNDRVDGSLGNDRVAGGTGNDRLTGGRGNDRLTGGPGDDVLSPGDGRDAVVAGAGNDTISARDGSRDTVDCGAGRDTVRADRRDRLKHCEKVTRR